MRLTQVFAAALVLAAAAASGKNVNESSQLPAENPFARESTLPYRLPPLDKIKDEHFKPALLAGMAEQRKEIDAIAKNSAAPTFENTVVAMERSGELLTRAWSVFGNLTSSVSTPRMREIEREIAPLEAAHDDAIRLDPELFARIDAVHGARNDAGLDAEDVRLVERYHLDFVLAGARLDEVGRARLTDASNTRRRRSRLRSFVSTG